MKIRDMIDQVLEWLRGSRRRQISAAAIGLGVIALAVGLPVYLAAFSGSDDRAEDVQSIPTPSPAVTLPTPTPEPTSTNAGTLAGGAIVFTGGELGGEEPPSVFLVDDDGVGRIGDNLHRGQLDLQPRRQPELMWSPDGSRAAFWQCPESPGEPGDPLAQSELYVVDAHGNGLTNVSNHPAPDIVLCFSDAPFGGFDWSPDSSRLAFRSSRDLGGLYVVNADASGLRYLGDGALPAWSPTGDAIVFAANSIGDESRWKVPIYTIDADGGERSLLAQVPCNFNFLHGCAAPQLRWSPDGSLLAFTVMAEPIDFSQPGAEENLNHEVFVIKADGTDLTNITNRPGRDSIANWVNCDLPLPTAGCELRVTNVQTQQLIVREDPGTDQQTIGKLSEGEPVCLLGSPALADGFQWWPLRSREGTEGWAAASDPAEPTKPWLTATGRTCREVPPRPTPEPTPAPRTEVCGGIFEDTIWAVADSPVAVTCDSALFPGNTLTIKPGVEVRFSDGTGLEIRGDLIAEGTESRHIVFTSARSVTGAWRGVQIEIDLGGAASIGFTDFFYAETAVFAEGGYGGMVDIADSSFNNNRTALGGYASCYTIVERSTFDGNTYAVTGGGKVISDSVFTNNEYGLHETEGISVYGSTFTENQVALYGGRGELKFSEISSNGTGIQGFFEGFTVTSNVIVNNDIGIVLTEGSNTGTTAPVKSNNIYGNTTYNVKNSVPADNGVANNWWGTTDTSQIDAGIYDGLDDSSLGIVRYGPILTEPVDISGGSTQPEQGLPHGERCPA